MSNEPAVGNWDEDFKDDNKGGGTAAKQDFPKALYLETKKPGVYKFRLVGAHVKFRKSFSPYPSVVQDGEKDISPAWKAGFFPPQKWAINVIDKTIYDKDGKPGATTGEPDGRLKILEKGATVFKHFANYKALFGIDPAGKDGPDFALTVKIPMKDGKPNKIKTEYNVTHLEKAPFTPADMKVICKTDENGNILKDDKGKPISNLWKLKEIYRSTSAEKMKKMWDELPDNKKIPPKRDFDKVMASDDDDATTHPSTESEPVEPIEEKMEGAPADSEDLFDNKAGGEKEKDSAELF